MRVISGKYKGKKIDGFDTIGTRPTMDRVKESVFGIIQNKVPGSIFLDLFAGSGSIGIEALSNGAKKCYFIESGRDISKVLNRNLKNIDNSEVLYEDYRTALKKLKIRNVKLDIIYIDPPYHLLLVNKTLELIKELEILNKNGIIIVEYEEEKIYDIFSLLKEKKYGKTSIKIYQQ